MEIKSGLVNRKLELCRRPTALPESSPAKTMIVQRLLRLLASA
jgi:hypothetical protein